MTGPSGKTIFRSAISGVDGEVDSGYLAMYIVMAIVTGAVPVMCLGAVIAMCLAPDHRFDVQGLGVGIGAACGGFATAIGAVGLFRMGDKPHPNTLTEQSSSSSSSSTSLPPAGSP